MNAFIGKDILIQYYTDTANIDIKSGKIKDPLEYKKGTLQNNCNSKITI